MTALLQPSIDCPAPQLGPNAQGIARVDVLDTPAQLVVTFERPITGQNYLLTARSYSLSGGQRLFPHILSATQYDPTGTPQDLMGKRVLLQLDGIGDFSIYTLTVSGPDIDPFFASHPLRFRLGCDDPFDCRPPAPTPPLAAELPVVIDYLAKDYSSFRQALLDFIPTRLPAWTERSEADIGMMLLELFAATADTLSYMQDRVANEAFLETATQRRSVAGHLALIGYTMDEGASAHTWLQFHVNALQPVDPGFRVTNQILRESEPIIVFETLRTATLRTEHNGMSVYNWGNQKCCLPQHALSAALVGEFPNLQAGEYLLFDQGPGQRDIVRLTAPAEIVSMPSGQRITVVRWSPATPLHRDYCLGPAGASSAVVTVRGNLIPATHGETVSDEALRDLTPEEIQVVEAEIAARLPGQKPPRQRLRLAQAPLAHLDPDTPGLAQGPAPAAAFTARMPRSLSTLTLHVEDEPWQERPTLLESGPQDKVFRVEIDDQGEATVVFGNDTFGLRPAETAKVTATYRVGGGAVGNVGADTLVRAQPGANVAVPWLVSVTNPLPAVGGRDLESRDHARRFGPPTFHQPLVAVTTADYQAAAQDFTDATGQKPIQRANAAFRWTGSWLTVTLTVDPRGTETVDASLRRALLAFLDTRRLAGYDLEINRPVYVAVELAIDICLLPGFLAGDVEQAILMALSNADLPGGRKGFFHPDNFTFGDRLSVSRLYAAVAAVPGVESAQITLLARFKATQPDRDTAVNLRQGYLAVGADEIVRLDNDRNFPQNGTLSVRTKGVGA